MWERVRESVDESGPEGLSGGAGEERRDSVRSAGFVDAEGAGEADDGEESAGGAGRRFRGLHRSGPQQAGRSAVLLAEQERIARIARLKAAGTVAPRARAEGGVLGSTSQAPQSCIQIVHKKLVEVPASVLAPSSRGIARMVLRTNHIAHLPDTLPRFLPALTELDLSHNRLQRVPHTLGNLGCLAKLLLNNNKLRSVPANLGALAQLTVLNVEKNDLAKLPSSLSCLTRLERLGLNNNERLREPPREVLLRGADAVCRHLAVAHVEFGAARAKLWAELARVGLSIPALLTALVPECDDPVPPHLSPFRPTSQARRAATAGPVLPGEPAAAATAAGRSWPKYRGLNALVGGWGGGEEAEQEGHLADGEGLSWSNFTKKLRGELMLQLSQRDLQTIWAALDEADDGCVTARAFLYQLKCTRTHTPFQARTLPEV
jgi:hypothetical protein